MRLGVNIDHIATLRQARRADEPDPVAGSFLASLGGADSIVVHLREDRRHIQDRDLEILRRVVTSHLNLEMAAAEEIIGIACRIRPDSSTLVPEKREEVTTEGGLDAAGQKDKLISVISRLKGNGIRVSLFVDPDPVQVKAGSEVGADAVEIHTGRYAEAHDSTSRKNELVKIIDAAREGSRLGLEVAAGHGLTYTNVRQVAAIPEIEELNIGHSIMSRAVLVGLRTAVAEMVEIIRQARIGIRDR